MPPERYVGISVVAGWLGVRPTTINKWLVRHVDFPVPDVVIEGERVTYGWRPEREEEIRTWYANPVTRQAKQARGARDENGQ